LPGQRVGQAVEPVALPARQLADRDRSGGAGLLTERDAGRLAECRRAQQGHEQGRAPAEARIPQRRSNGGSVLADSWILFLEAGGVLALMLFFVWWTMRGKK
jgi:hypothetical protein